MIQRQQRREVVSRPPEPVTPDVAGHLAEDAVTVDAAGATVTSEAPALPRQERRPRRDAYDLYAQIYAIRTEHPAP